MEQDKKNLTKSFLTKNNLSGFIIPQKVIEEINSIKSGNFFQYTIPQCNNIRDFIKLKIKSLDENLPIIIFIKGEIDPRPCFLDYVTYLNLECNLDIRISMSTASFYKFGCHPLTNIYFWNDLDIRNTIDWNSKTKFNLFSNGKILFDYFPNKKKYRGIFSVRKQTSKRDLLFSFNPTIKDGITRYAKWPNLYQIETKKDIQNSINFPNMETLLNEYKQSYFSFIVESENYFEEINFSILTEKTIIAILTKTMPIVLGNQNYIRDLELIGIKVWNNDFGFQYGDEYLNNSDFKIKSFVNCIHNINEMSMDEIDKFYNKNLEYIEKNYNIIKTIFSL